MIASLTNLLEFSNGRGRCANSAEKNNSPLREVEAKGSKQKVKRVNIYCKISNEERKRDLLRLIQQEKHREQSSIAMPEVYIFIHL